MKLPYTSMIYFELIYLKRYEEREFQAEFEGIMDKRERKVV